MTEDTNKSMTTIELLGKPYQIRCHEHEIPTLQKAAHSLNEAMNAMPNSAKLPPDKLAIMAALNFAAQLSELEEKAKYNVRFINQRLGSLQTKLEHALGPQLEQESAEQA